MASIYDLPKVPQPYPESAPWHDLSAYLVSDWEGGGATFTFRASVDGNRAHIYLRTRRGIARPVCATLPDELLPPGQLLIGADAEVQGKVWLLIQTTGECLIYAPTRGYEGLIDGTLSNYVVSFSYVRRVS